MYCLYVVFEYTYIDINSLAQGIKFFFAPQVWFQAGTGINVCMYVYMYVWMHVSMYVLCMYVCMYVCMHAWTYIDPSLGGPMKLFLVPASDPQRPWYVVFCLWDGVYKRTLAVNRRD